MKTPPYLLILLTLFLIGCDGGATPNSNNSNSPRNVTPPPLPTSAPANSTANSRSIPTKANKPAAPAAPRTPQPPQEPSPSTGKKVEGLFSFPPPRALDEFDIPNVQLANREGQTTFSDVSQKLSDGLRQAGYPEEKYSYFWNNENEFALVTAMERVNIKGEPILTEERFEVSPMLQAATLWDGKYWEFLFSGKKEYFRVLVFIVTSKDLSFTGKDVGSPTFEMAASWKSQGTRRLGSSPKDGGVDQGVVGVTYDDRYHCSVLLYLFVNHTSLEGPMAATLLKDEGSYLLTGLNKDVRRNLKVTNIPFGERK
jgi:hypothetical protein